MNQENLIWRDRFFRLKQFIEDGIHDIQNKGFEKAENRCWDAPETLYVSFGMDSCDTEEVAIKTFGKGKYDVYRLVRKGDD